MESYVLDVYCYVFVSYYSVISLHCLTVGGINLHYSGVSHVSYNFLCHYDCLVLVQVIEYDLCGLIQ